MRRGNLVPLVPFLALGWAAILLSACNTGSSTGSLAGSAEVPATGRKAGIRIVIPSLEMKTSTDASGSFTLADIPPGTYLAVAEDNAYQWQERKTVTVRKGETTRVDFSLARDLTVGSLVGAVPRSVLDPGGFTLITFVRGNYAFLGDRTGGVPIVDVTNPALPVVLRIIAPLSPGANAKSYMSYCTEDGNYLVVANDIDGALFYDVTDKSNPVLRRQVYEVDNAYGGYDPAGIPGFPYPVSPGKRILLPLSVTGAGNVVYVGGRDTLLVYDISSRANPALLAGYNIPGEGSDLQLDGSRLYFTSDNLAIFDVSDPGRPARIGTYAHGGAGVAASGPFAALSRVSDGLEFLDVSDPAAARPLATFPVTSQGADASWDGYFYAATADSMTVYLPDPASASVGVAYTARIVDDYAMNVAVSGEYAYVSDKSAGLKIVKIK